MPFARWKQHERRRAKTTFPEEALRRFAKNRVAVISAIVVVGLVAAGGAYLLWKQHEGAALPKGIVGINGRLKATQVDIATKIAGRVIEIVPHEGDMVSAGIPNARLIEFPELGHAPQVEAPELFIRRCWGRWRR
jgi:HlyD family secretion protein